jgi:hypothetical protein
MSETVTERTRKPATAGPLSTRDRLALASRVTKSLAPLDIVAQRGVVGVAAVVTPSDVPVLLRVLRALAKATRDEDRHAVVEIVAACLMGEAEVVGRGEAMQRLVPGTVTA